MPTIVIEGYKFRFYFSDIHEPPHVRVIRDENAIQQIEWLAWLAAATPEQRAKWSLEPGGYAVYWEDLDDGIEVCHILDVQPLA